MLNVFKFCRYTAYKLFGKRIFKTSGRLVASTQLLQNPVPTQDCDIILTFPRNADTSTLMWLLDRLRSRSPDIIVHVRHHSNTKEAVFHLTATYERYEFYVLLRTNCEI